MQFSAIFIIAQRELIRYGRDKGRIISTLIQSVMFLAVFGGGFSKILGAANFGIDFVQFMFPGIIAMNIMGTAFFSTVSTVWDREFGFLKEILVAPISRTSIALGKVCGAVVIATAQALVLLALAPFLHINIYWTTIVPLIIVMVLLSFAIAGLGLLFASIVRSIENFGLIMNLLVFPMFFLSGAFFPLTNVPGWMKIISAINPLTYGVDTFRQIILRPQVSAAVLARFVLHPAYVDIVFLAVFFAIMISAAVVAFNKKG